MNTIHLKLAGILMLVVLFSCKPDKKAELNELKKQHDVIADKIKKLESGLVDSSKIEKKLNVSVADIKPSVFKHYIEVQGKLDGENNVDVFPEAQGVIDKVYVSIGQTVKQGQPLARLNDAAAKDNIRALETQYKFVKETFEKQDTLWKQKIGSQMQYLQAKAAKEALESQLSSAREQISMMTIKSPINGTVEEINAKLGQFASAQSPTPPFRVLNFGMVKVKADVAEGYASKVNVGDNVVVYFPDINKEINAKISTASRYISPLNRTFTVEVRLAPENYGFKANMVAVLKINDYKADNALVIPINYIQSDPKGNFVYIAQNKDKKYIAKKAFVGEGQSYDGKMEITKGLKPEDKIITSNYLELEENETITF